MFGTRGPGSGRNLSASALVPLPSSRGPVRLDRSLVRIVHLGGYSIVLAPVTSERPGPTQDPPDWRGSCAPPPTPRLGGVRPPAERDGPLERPARDRWAGLARGDRPARIHRRRV